MLKQTCPLKVKTVGSLVPLFAWCFPTPEWWDEVGWWLEIETVSSHIYIHINAKVKQLEIETDLLHVIRTISLISDQPCTRWNISVFEIISSHWKSATTLFTPKWTCHINNTFVTWGTGVEKAGRESPHYMLHSLIPFWSDAVDWSHDIRLSKGPFCIAAEAVLGNQHQLCAFKVEEEVAHYYTKGDFITYNQRKIEVSPSSN